MKATNRQKKILRFFGISFSPELSAGAAGWEIDLLSEDPSLYELWLKYLFLTDDFDNSTDQLCPFDLVELENLTLPDDWDKKEAKDDFIRRTVEDHLKDHSPYDRPQPPITFKGKKFLFTGKFNLGTRQECKKAVIERGGVCYTSTSKCSALTDYLVIGAGGSPHWSRGKYGNKIESAIFTRREHGHPAIISEEHWVCGL